MAGVDPKAVPRAKWLPDELWEAVKRSLPIATLDIVFERSGKTLLGYRRISPYRNVWAFPGGRFLFGESLTHAARRVASEYGLTPRELYLVGVFPVRFKSRSDVAVAVASPEPDGEPVADGYEFSSLKWFSEPPPNTGGNYLKMLTRWRTIRQNTHLLYSNRV